MDTDLVVETSTHSINGRRLRATMKAHLRSEASLWEIFPVKNITMASSHLT
jgi:hypothetical protein